MAIPLPRILSAVPQTLHVRLEIAKAIQTLVAPEQGGQLSSTEMPSARRDSEVVKDCVSVFRQEFLALARSHLKERRSSAVKAAVDDPKHPGWPAHTPEGKGGEFRPKDEIVAAADGPPPGIGHNQGPPLEDPPAIPATKPPTTKAVNAFLKAAAYWLATATRKAAARFLLALQAAAWLGDGLKWIYAYNYPAKTLEELQADAQKKPLEQGYNIHHIVEQTPARRDKFPDSMIDGPENLVRIPTLKHWQITAWYQTPNPYYKDPNNPDDPKGISPRDYLRGKSWDERRKIGLQALIDFGVLKP